ncbi:RsmB/NOP family class I SAM-dependent RNA methyltransferase [Corynebacterium sp.]|uniref:RsmB/NOP family class I SAM-dependent RNA methyltransferase n=1 Tax=Corynebacterium sp. TaxID=1720 RepID=UPI0026DD0AF5|nr:transcription antitermination factor NusB [Corynebacterium sp.]MDO4609420.1 transcription antitermination factor NusB [Corynebacterium sp.]
MRDDEQGGASRGGSGAASDGGGPRRGSRRRNAAGERRGRRRDQGGRGGRGGRGTGAGGARGGRSGGRGHRRDDRDRGRGAIRHLDDAVDAPRAAALEVIAAVRDNGAYANLALPAALRRRRLTGRDAAFATELAYGTLRARGLVDAVVDLASSRPLDHIDPELLDVLRMGAYQLLRTRVGAHAAVDTSVAAAEALGAGAAKGFVNAVLRTVATSSEDEWIGRVAPDAQRDPIGHLAMRHNHPRWIAEAFAQALGADAAELADALAADDARPIVHLAARPGEITAEELALVTGGEVGPWSPYAVRLDDGGDPGELQPVRDRLASVQDEGSQLIARALTEAPLEGADGGRWLDLCAGPGGKAAFLGAVAAIDGACVDAVEPQEKRAKLVRGAVGGLPVHVHVADGRDPGLEPGYDRVLVDAPCSGLGSLRRRPESRWTKDPSDLRALTTLQGQLLASAAELVRPGGVIVYSTCSPHLRETRGAVDHAVRTFGLEELDAHGLVAPMDRVGDHPSVQMWPHRHGTDAMFFAVLRRPAE